MKQEYQSGPMCIKARTATGSSCPWSKLLNVIFQTTEDKSILSFKKILNKIQTNLVIRNVLIRNKLVLRNHFSWPSVNLLHEDKEHLALRNNFGVTKKFLITKFDCAVKIPWKYMRQTQWHIQSKRKKGRSTICSHSQRDWCFSIKVYVDASTVVYVIIV